MKRNYKQFILVSIILLCMLTILSASYASTNDTVIMDDSTGATTSQNVADNKILTSTPDYEDIYFDASSSSDTEDGSITNPYKTFTASNVRDNSILHINSGDYNFNGSKTVKNVKIIGNSTINTIVRNAAFVNNAEFNVYNITFIDSNINSANTLSIENTVFENSLKTAVSSSKGSVNIDNCKFVNASSITGSSLNIKNSVATINNSIITNNTAENGGGIQVFNSTLQLYNTELLYNMATQFGGAITSINSTVKINNATVRSNKAQYNGGALFSIYGLVEVVNSTFENNSAYEAGAILVDGVNTCTITGNIFIDNYATRYYDVYSLDSNNTHSLLDSNSFMNLSASTDENVYNSTVPNLFIGNGNTTPLTSLPPYEGKIPSYYDLRNDGLVTSIKNQGAGGNCWAFSTLAALESAILKISGQTYDFSEENMKNLMALYSDYGWTYNTNDGGTTPMELGYLTSWLGPVNEDDDAYQPNSILSPVLDGLFHVQNIMFLERKNYTDNNAIKKAILDYGAVSSNIGWYNNFQRSNTYYCNDATVAANHAIAVIGWDNYYSKYNFRYTPPADGAWIIKNSWGSSGGEGGYYYVSYYDTTFALTDISFAFVFNDTTAYDKNYQYDIPGYTDYFLNYTTSAWYKNVFTATDHEYLEAVSTYFMKPTAYEITVNVNNKLKLTQNASTAAGYYTTKLNQKIELHKGDVFEVIYKICQEDETAIPISEKISLNKLFYRENISFVSYDGENWNDFYNLTWIYPNHTYDSQVACIKAFTKKINITIEVEALTENPCTIIASVHDEYNNTIDLEQMVFVVNDEEITVDTVDAKAELVKILPYGENNVTVKVIENGTVLSTKTVEIFVTQPVDTKINVVTHVEDSLDINALIVGPDGELTNGIVIFKVNGKTLRDDEGKVIYVEVVDGIAKLDYNIPSSWIGSTVNITSVYSGSEIAYLTNSTLHTIAKKEATVTITPFTSSIPSGSNITLKARVTYNGNPVSTGKVVFKINGKTLKDETGKQICLEVDSNGEVNIDYWLGKLKSREYELIAVFTSPEYQRAESSIKFIVVK